MMKQVKDVIRYMALSLIFSVLLSGTASGYPELEGTININAAKVEQLSLFYRVGEKMTQRIIDYREAHGDFTAVEELMNVPGIGEKTFEHLKPFLAVDGETTLQEKE